MRALVTGGGGFLGSAIAHRLLDRGWAVRIFSRGDYPRMRAAGVSQIRGDLAEGFSVDKAVADMDVVFHVGARAGVWGDPFLFRRANVEGTQHVIDACRKHAVRYLIFTSSPSVTFSGRDQSGVDETEPYPRRYLATYPKTKAEAERMVLAANDRELSTVALRPHLIWGPGDPHLVPRVIERAQAGRLRLVGSGENRVDTTYIDNAAQAHLDAADRLIERGQHAACAGRAYFISNDEPITMGNMLNRILDAAGLPPVTCRVSPRLAYAAGAVLEGIYKVTKRMDEPVMTRFVARQLATEHWFDLTRAKQDLGYRPTVSLDEGFQRLRESLRD